MRSDRLGFLRGNDAACRAYDWHNFMIGMTWRTPPCYNTKGDVRFIKRRWLWASLVHALFCRRLLPHVVGRLTDELE